MGRLLFFLALCGVIGLSGAMFYTSWSKQGGSFSQFANVERDASRIPAPPIGKCINMGGALEAPEEGDWGYSIREADFKRLKNAGFDSVRIPIRWSEHTKNKPPFTVRRYIFKRIDEVVEQALRNDLKVIINVHHYEEISEDAETHLPRLYEMWDQIIDRYKDTPDAVMFEFLNEPHTSMTAARVNEMNRVLLEKVRAVNPDRWVVLGGGHWGTLEGLTSTNPPFDEKAMVTFHYYSPFEFTHQGAPWAHKEIEMGQTWGSQDDRKRMVRDFSDAAHWRDKVGMPMLLGEFGVYVKVPDQQRAEWTEKVRKTAEEVGFGWCYWDYATSLGIYDLEVEHFKPGMVEALMAD